MQSSYSFRQFVDAAQNNQPRAFPTINIESHAFRAVQAYGDEYGVSVLYRNGRDELTVRITPEGNDSGRISASGQIENISFRSEDSFSLSPHGFNQLERALEADFADRSRIMNCPGIRVYPNVLLPEGKCLASLGVTHGGTDVSFIQSGKALASKPTLSKP